MPRLDRYFSTLYRSLLRLKPEGRGPPGQDKISEAESKNIRRRILAREDGTEEVVEEWEFESLLDYTMTKRTCTTLSNGNTIPRPDNPPMT